jgi:hypothetical protein
LGVRGSLCAQEPASGRAAHKTTQHVHMMHAIRSLRSAYEISRLDFGVLNFDLLKGEKGGKLWANARLRDRIDAAISHEYEELLANGNHAKAIKNAAKTKLPISDMAKRINRARAR